MLLVLWMFEAKVALDSRCQQLTRSERLIGHFEQDSDHVTHV